MADPRAVRRASVRAHHPAHVLADLLQPGRPLRRLHTRQLQDAGDRPGFRRPAEDDADPGDQFEHHLLCVRRAHGLAGRAHRHAAAPYRACAGHGILRDTAVPWRHCVGGAGGAQQRSPQQDLPRGDRRSAGRAPLQHLLARGPDLRHLLLHLPVCIRAARQRARSHSRRSRGCVIDSRRPHLDDRAAHYHPAGAACAPGRRAGRIPAGDDAVRLAGDPGNSRRLPHHDHQNLEPVQLSAQGRACGGGVRAPAGPHGGAAARRALHSRPPRIFGGRWQAGRPATDPAGRAQMGGARVRLRHPHVPGVSALWRSPQRHVLAGRHIVRNDDEFHPAQYPLRVLRIVGDQAGGEEHLPARRRLGHHRHDHGGGDCLCHDPAGHPGLSRARLSRHRSGRDSRHRARRRAVPELCAAAPGPLWHIVDPADRLRDHRAAGRLSAAPVGLSFSSYRP